MTELRFHRAVYAGNAVDEAVEVYRKFGAFERADDDAYFGVRVTATKAARERQVAGELANYALGLTVRKGARR